jgi:arabinofuranosyltransferase
MITTRKTLLLCFSVTIAVLVFLKNAWVSEDAYIVFRSIEQLFAGNGPIWNPHERVQAFTSPFWFWLLSFARVFSSDVYLNAITVSFVLWLVTIFLVRKILDGNGVLLLAILLFSASTAFFDYTSSGLENILAYCVIAAYLLAYVRVFSASSIEIPLEDRVRTRAIKSIFLLFGLTILVRHDLTLLLLPPTAYALVKNSKVFSRRGWVLILGFPLFPVIAWTLFSIIYYGFPFPNTAYAKLNTGINQIDLLWQGLQYFLSSIEFDPITLLVIGLFVANTFALPTEPYLKYASYGIVLNLLYVLYVGGDFMQGRFFSYAYLVSVILLLKRGLRPVKITPYAVGALAAYAVFFSHTPLNSPLSHSYQKIEMGVADERGYYFAKTSLYKYIVRKDWSAVFPDHEWVQQGFELRSTPAMVDVKGNIGLAGYWAGLDKKIVDHFALSDPLLARLPTLSYWRIGHFIRGIPEGYIESVKNNLEVIEDIELNEFYKKLKILTQSEKLFTKERLKTIFRFNTGAYNHLIEGMGVTKFIPAKYTDADWQNGVIRPGANKGTLPGPGIFLLVLDLKKPLPFSLGDTIVFASSGPLRVVHITQVITQVAYAEEVHLFVSVDKPLDPIGDGYPNRVKLGPKADLPGISSL